MEVDPSSQSPNGSDTTFWAFGAPVPKQPPFLSIPAAVRASPVFVFLLVFYLYFWRRFFHKKHGFFIFQTKGLHIKNLLSWKNRKSLFGQQGTIQIGGTSEASYILEVLIDLVLGIRLTVFLSSCVRLLMCCLSLRLVTLTTEPPWSHLVWTWLAHSPGGCICSQKPPSFSPGTPVLLLLLRAQTSALCLFQSCWADFCLAFSTLLTGSLTLGFSLHAGGSMAWLL